MKSRTLLTIGLALLAGCQSARKPAQTLHIAITPAAHPTSEAVLNCAPTSEDLFIDIDSLYLGTFEPEDYDLVIQLGEPTDGSGFLAQIAEEEIVLISNFQSEREPGRSEAADLFTGRVEGGGLWVGPQSDEARQIFTSEVLLGAPVVGSAHLASTQEQMLAEVAADSTALGVLPAAWANETVRVIRLGVGVPVLISAKSEPSGAARELIACLQSLGGQEMLSERYGGPND